MQDYVVAFVAIFVGAWCLGCWVFSAVGGWRSLAKAHAAQMPRTGRAYSMQSALIGPIVYASCLSIRLSPAGIHLSILPLWRIAHPPLLIPWSDLRELRERQTLFMTFVEANVGTPVIARIALPRPVFEEARRLGYLSF